MVQPVGVARRDDYLADVKVIAMRHGYARDHDASRLVTRLGIFGKTRELLEQGQGAELERVQI